MFISGIGAAPTIRVTGATPVPVPPVEPVTAPMPLSPAVRVDIRGRESGSDPRAERPRESAEDTRRAEEVTEPRIRIDRDTKAVVYQEVDPSSGDVVVQLPEPTVLKARAYAEAAEARARPADRPLDRTA